MTPENINEWIGVALGILALAGMFYRVSYRQGKLAESTESRFKTQGERLGGVELNFRESHTAIEELRRIDQQHEFKILNLTEDNGETRGEIKQLMITIQEQGGQRSARDMEIVDRLARIEERLDLSLKMQGVIPKT